MNLPLYAAALPGEVAGDGRWRWAGQADWGDWGWVVSWEAGLEKRDCWGLRSEPVSSEETGLLHLGLFFWGFVRLWFLGLLGDVLSPACTAPGL